MYTLKRYSGFSLLELMIVVVILGVLAGIAYPTYTSFVTKAKRSDAKAALIKLQIAQEKFRTSCSQYATAIGSAYSCTPGNYTLIGSTSSPDGYYTVDISDLPTSTTFTIIASPLAPFTDDTCGTFAVNESGPLYTGYANTECWGK